MMTVMMMVVIVVMMMVAIVVLLLMTIATTQHQLDQQQRQEMPTDKTRPKSETKSTQPNQGPFPRHAQHGEKEVVHACWSVSRPAGTQASTLAGHDHKQVKGEGWGRGEGLMAWGWD